MALFLTAAGLTGSILAFDDEINRWLNPPRRLVAHAGPMLDPVELRERALALIPQGQSNGNKLQQKPDEAYTITVEPRDDPATGKPYELAFNTLVLDPYTGDEIERIKTPDGLWPMTRQNFIPLIVALHYRLAVPGSIGAWLFGIAAVIWTLDCFVAFYLTLPVRITGGEDRKARRTWWVRWMPSWRVQWQSSTYRINLDLHRSGGLWTWAMLFVLAWSGVALNLGEQVYTPVMKVLFGMSDPYGDRSALKTPQPDPALGWREAHAIGQQLMAEQARAKGFTVQREEFLSYDPGKGAYFYGVRSDRDVSDEWDGTTVLFDAASGQFAGLILPSGQNAGTTITTWIVTLHMAAIWGVPFKIFVCVMGLVVAMLSVTDVYLWLKKRRSRAVASRRRTRSASLGD